MWGAKRVFLTGRGATICPSVDFGSRYGLQRVVLVRPGEGGLAKTGNRLCSMLLGLGIRGGKRTALSGLRSEKGMIDASAFSSGEKKLGKRH
jgi:hypothetical protein